MLWSLLLPWGSAAGRLLCPRGSPAPPQARPEVEGQEGPVDSLETLGESPALRASRLLLPTPPSPLLHRPEKSAPDSLGVWTSAGKPRPCWPSRRRQKRSWFTSLRTPISSPCTPAGSPFSQRMCSWPGGSEASRRGLAEHRAGVSASLPVPGRGTPLSAPGGLSLEELPSLCPAPCHLSVPGAHETAWGCVGHTFPCSVE